MASKTVIRPIQIRPYPNNPALAINLTIPNSRWIAGCCVEPKELLTITSAISADQKIINLFPGNRVRSNPNNNIDLDNQAPADSFCT